MVAFYTSRLHITVSSLSLMYAAFWHQVTAAILHSCQRWPLRTPGHEQGHRSPVIFLSLHPACTTRNLAKARALLPWALLKAPSPDCLRSLGMGGEGERR